MFDIKIISIGKIKETYFKNAIQEYLKRLKPYAKIKYFKIKAEAFNNFNKENIKNKESDKLIKFLEKYKVQNIFLLHEAGKSFKSLEFANFINKNQEIIFVIGGSLGFSKKLLNKYQQISLSKLTFLHEMVQIILLEQIYRAISILKNKNYHY